MILGNGHENMCYFYLCMLKVQILSIFHGNPGPFNMFSFSGKMPLSREIPYREETLKQTHYFGICINIRKMKISKIGLRRVKLAQMTP